MKLSRWFRRTLIVLALVAGGVGAFYAFLQSGPGRDLTRSLIESAASSDNLKIAIEGLEGALPASPRAAKVTIGDADGAWLVLHDVRLRWSPLSLIGGNIIAEEITADRIEWLRLPKGGEDSSDSEGGLPSLAIGKLAVTTVEIAPEVAGKGGTFSLKASADTLNTAERARLVLQLVELAGGSARIDIEAHYKPTDNIFDLNAAIDDRAGGTLATMLSLPPDAPLRVTLKSTGTLDNWQADLTGAGGTALSASGRATIVREADWRKLSLNLNADIVGIGPDAWRSLYEGRSTIDIAAARSDTGAWRVDRLAAATPALTLNGTGAFDAAAERADGNATLTIPRGAAVAALIDNAADWRDLTVTAKAEGGWPKPAIVIDLRAADIAAEDIRASALTGHITAEPDRQWDDPSVRVSITSRFDAAELTSDDEDLRALLGPTATMTLQAMLIEWQRASGIAGELKTTAASLRFAGDADRRALNGVVSLDAPNLAPAGFRSGAASLNATIEANLEASRWSAEGKGFATDVAPGGALDAVLAGKQELTFAIQGTGPGALRLSSLVVQGERLSLNANGQIAKTALNLNAAAALANLNALSPDSEGRAVVDLHVAGTPDAPRISGTASLASGKLFGRAVETLLLELSEADANGLSRLTVKGKYDAQPVAGSANVAWRGEGGARIENLDVALRSLTLKGNAAVEGAGLITGTLALDAREIADIAPFIGEDIAGALAGTLQFKPVAKKQTLTAALKGPRFSIDDARFGGVALSGTIDDLFGAVAMKARLTAATADFDGFELQNLEATTHGPFAALVLDAKAMREGTSVVTRATLKLENEPTVISVASLQLARGDKTARLASPINITLADSKILIPQTRILAGGGSVTLAGDAGTTMDIGLNATALPLWVAAFVTEPLPVTGTASGTARIREAGATSFDLKIVNLAPEADPRIVRNVSMSATGQTDRTGVDFKVTLADAGRTSFQANGRVPFAANGPLQIDVNGTADLAIANVYLSVTGDRARGTMTASARVTGTRAAPSIQGSGKIANGFFRSAASGFELRDMSVDFTGSERRIAVTSLSAKAANDGAITGSGDIALDPANGYPINLAIKANDAQLVSTELTTVVADVDARMTGGLFRDASIAGSAEVELWEIRLPQRLARPLNPIRVSHRNAPADIAAALPREPQGDTDEAQSSLTFGLDISVRAPRRVHVRGQGIAAEFGGRVKVTGTVDRPEINGRFDLRRGTVELLSQRLALTRGRIDFAGDIIPIIDIAAEARKTDVTASIGVKGKATQPEITLSSTPVLPQDEIMSRVLFNKSTQQLSAFEAVQLAGAIARLSGLASGPGILDRLRTSLGIDSLGAVTDTKGDTALSAGSYVGSGVYLGFVQGTDTSAGRATVDLDLTDDIKLRGEVGPSGDNRLGVVAEWEY